MEVEATVDNGACETVMSSGLCSGMSITRSISLHGAEYEVANVESIPDLGERRCLPMTLGISMATNITFQVADVHKALLSTSWCADMGFDTCLGRHGGFLQDAVSGEQIPLHRRDNLYVMNAWVKRDPETTTSPQIPPAFVGPGRS